MRLGICTDVTMDNHILVFRELLQLGNADLGGVQDVEFQFLFNNLKNEEMVKIGDREVGNVI